MIIDLKNDVKIDTDTLTDKEAEISEAINNLHKICERYDVTSFTSVIFNNAKFIGSRTFTNNQENRPIQYDSLVARMAEFLHETSQGNLAVMVAKPDEPESDEEKLG